MKGRSSMGVQMLDSASRTEMDALIELEVSKLDFELENADAELSFQDYSDLIHDEDTF